VEIRDPTQPMSRRRKKAGNTRHSGETAKTKITKEMEDVLTCVVDGDARELAEIWTNDPTQSLVHPTACSWYDGWPQPFHAFRRHHGIQELNFPWSEFLYAWVPASGLLPLRFAKISAAASAYGVVVESCYGPPLQRPNCYLIHFRSF
jgi:hypothetical protein